MVASAIDLPSGECDAEPFGFLQYVYVAIVSLGDEP